MLGIARCDLYLAFTDTRHLVDPPEQGERVVHIAVAGISRDARKLRDDGLYFRNGWEFGEFHKGHLACEQIRIVNHGAGEEQLAANIVRRQGAYRVAAKGGITVE